eukprot:Selendium_serpulae@DN4863_c0_g1_i1.p1
MGATGPCGPCSEIHYDRIGNRDAASLVNEDDPSVLEIWNLVFMQFNRREGGVLAALPKKCIDTGMGLERIASILQDKQSNYDTDGFTPIFEAIRAAIPGLREYTGKVGDEDPEKLDMAYRVVADHIRTLVVAMSDGVLPSNEGRGYVLRRILRRAVRYGRQFLNAPRDKAWLSQLVDVVVAQLGRAYPEMEKDPAMLAGVIADEEVQFGKTLDKGVNLFNRIAKKLKESGQQGFPGDVAFDLYATYGFPVDLTEIMAQEMQLSVDMKAFQDSFAAHKASSENTSFTAASALTLPPDKQQELMLKWGVDGANDDHKFEWEADKGEGSSLTATIKAIWNGTAFVEDAALASGKDPVAVFLDRTNYYAESGGQVGDSGVFVLANGGKLQVLDCKKAGSNAVMHIVKTDASDFDDQATTKLKVGDSLSAEPDFSRRGRIAKNHTATHVLNHSLRKILGATCDQKGSLVEESRLRMDFASNRGLTPDEIGKLEEDIENVIKASMAIDNKLVELEKAKAINGLRAVFGECYPDPVRVVSVGETVQSVVDNPTSGSAESKSVELCGGTHLDSTAALEAFAVTSEESLAKGVRRIIAATGREAKDIRRYGNEMDQKKEWAKALKGLELDAAIVALENELNSKKDLLPYVVRRKCKDAIEELQKQRVNEGKAKTKALMALGKQRGSEEGKSTDTNWKVLLLNELEGETKALEAAMQAFVAARPTCGVLMVSTGPKATMVMAEVPVDSTKSALDWSKACLDVLGGKGGGQARKARGTAGPKPEAELKTALKVAENFVESS